MVTFVPSSQLGLLCGSLDCPNKGIITIFESKLQIILFLDKLKGWWGKKRVMCSIWVCATHGYFLPWSGGYLSKGAAPIATKDS